ncbi:hypothetical protein D6855_12505 [Butyrivibrio sp. CB08]|uniref:hypothetical protein n=1 Tax=Butyrivibrio sp. CB08 TaxID=2364879 RepID=UPI000EA9C33C|nr:hypothetical protein [Butyrivibrio sp. CB08]RKM57865.1 hypothetical protein D6855_12505 [Butyrivibrio sp. CB08]
MRLLSLVAYLLRIILLGSALGMMMTKYKLFKQLECFHTFLIGMAATPMFISTICFLLGMVFIGGASQFFFFVPIVISLFLIAINKNYLIILSNYKRIFEIFREFVSSSGKGIIWDLFFSFNIVFCYLLLFNGVDLQSIILEIYNALNLVGLLVLLILAVIIFVAIFITIHRCTKNGRLEKHFFICILLIVIGTCGAHTLSMISRPDLDSDRAHYELEARYFCEDKNSWEVDNYFDEKYGSSFQDDHGPLWTLYLADAYIVADTCGDNDSLWMVNLAVFWAYFCFVVILFEVASYVSKNYKAGVISLFFFHEYEHTLLMVAGSRDAFRFIGLLLLIIYILCHIEDISTGKARWVDYFFLLVFCYFCINGHAANIYIMFGLFIAVGLVLIGLKTPIQDIIAMGLACFVGTLLGVIKEIKNYVSSGYFYNAALLIFHDTPIVEQMSQKKTMRTDPNIVMQSYSYSVKIMIVIGIIGLITMLIVAWKRRKKRIFFFSVCNIGMLLPLTGMMDWLGYEASVWFVVQIRYRMYFLLLLSITGAWLLTQKTKFKVLNMAVVGICVVMFGFFLRTEVIRYSTINKAEKMNKIEIVREYKEIADIVSDKTRGDVYTRDQVLLLYLHGTPKLLYHPVSEDLIQAKTETEIADAIEKLNVGAVILPEDGVDNYDFSLLPFWEYINNNEHFSKIRTEDRQGEVDKVIFYRDK